MPTTDVFRALHAIATAPEPLIVVRIIVNQKGQPEQELPRGRVYVSRHPLNRKEPPNA